MKPLTLTLKGIGAWRQETTIDFASLDSPVAVVGPFGVGKSWILESILFALYSRGGWYAGSIYDIQTQGGDGESYIHLTFEHKGATYRIERHINKGHSACVYRNDEIVAGPKVGDVARWVETNIGTWETAASTWFLSQSRANDLCGQPGDKDLAARRRAVFNELLGIADLDAEAEKMRAERARCIAQVEVLEAQLAGEDNEAGKVGWCRMELETARRALCAAEAEAENTEAVVERRRDKLSELTQSYLPIEGERQAAEAQIQAAEKAVKDAEDWGVRVDTLRQRVGRLAGAEQDVEALDAARGARVPLLSALQAREAWEQACRDYDCAVARQEALRREIEALEVSLPDSETVALSGKDGEVAEQLHEIGLANNKAKAHNEVLTKRRATMERNIATGQAEVDRLRKRIAQKPVTPFGDDCAPCPLMREWAGLPEELVAREANLANHRGTLDALSAPMELQDASELLTLRAQVHEAIQAVLRGGAAQAKINRLEAEQYEPAAPSSEPEDPRQQLDELQERIEALSGAPEKSEAHHRAQADLKEAMDSLDVAEGLAHVARYDKKKALQERERLAEQQGTMAAELAEAEAAHGEARRIYTETRQSLQARHTVVGRAEAALEEAEKRAQAQTEKREQVQALTVRRAALDDLVACFGPRGVRQILTDAAAPELEDIADQLFEMATEGRMRLRIATQRLLRDGSIAEDFGILIKDQAGEREALEHSGGELQLVSILLRLSVCMWIARLKGQKPDVLLLDEAFDRLGAEGAEDLLRVLDSMAERIGCIIVVTHDPVIAGRLRSQVRVVKSMSGSRVEV